MAVVAVVAAPDDDDDDDDDDDNDDAAIGFEPMVPVPLCVAAPPAPVALLRTVSGRDPTADCGRDGVADDVVHDRSDGSAVVVCTMLSSSTLMPLLPLLPLLLSPPTESSVSRCVGARECVERGADDGRSETRGAGASAVAVPVPAVSMEAVVAVASTDGGVDVDCTACC